MLCSLCLSEFNCLRTQWRSSENCPSVKRTEANYICAGWQSQKWFDVNAVLLTVVHVKDDGLIDSIASIKARSRRTTSCNRPLSSDNYWQGNDRIDCSGRYRQRHVRGLDLLDTQARCSLWISWQHTHTHRCRQNKDFRIVFIVCGAKNRLYNMVGDWFWFLSDKPVSISRHKQYKVLKKLWWALLSGFCCQSSTFWLWSCIQTCAVFFVLLHCSVIHLTPEDEYIIPLLMRSVSQLGVLTLVVHRPLDKTRCFARRYTILFVQQIDLRFS